MSVILLLLLSIVHIYVEVNQELFQINSKYL